MGYIHVQLPRCLQNQSFPSRPTVFVLSTTGPTVSRTARSPTPLRCPGLIPCLNKDKDLGK